MDNKDENKSEDTDLTTTSSSSGNSDTSAVSDKGETDVEIKDHVEILQRIRATTSDLADVHAEEHSMRGTQTPLTLIDATLAKHRDGDKNSRYVHPRHTEIERATIPVALNLSEQSSSSFTMQEDASLKSTFPQLRVDEVTVKISHEAATQATPPHPSLTSAKSETPRDILTNATSVSSERSAPKSEVLTVTTDYATRTPEATSFLLDVIDHDHPRRYINVQSSNPTVAIPSTMDRVQSSAMQQRQATTPPYNGHQETDNFLRRSSLRRWSLQTCFRRNDPPEEDPETRPYTLGPPPTYSTIFTERRPLFIEPRLPLPRRSSNESSGSFVVPVPPPSYAQAQGLCMAPYSMEQLISVAPTRVVWSPRPMATICPRCTAVIVTVIEVRRSAVTHVTALILFLFGCWPCCLIPYCISACKRINHYCPVCRTYLGTYTPW